MARKAHSRITRTFSRWAAEVSDNTVIRATIWNPSNPTKNGEVEFAYYGVETGWTLIFLEVTDETVTALASSLISGKDVAGILADRMEELGHSEWAERLHRGNKVEIEEAKKEAARKKAKAKRDAMKDAMESLGLKKVRGAMGGTYWE